MKKIKKMFLLFSLLFLLFMSLQKGELIIKGSDTMVNLVAALVEKYTKENPRANITVMGGGSGVGIAGLIDKEIVCANSSRELKESEKKKLKENGVDYLEIPIAYDLLCIIVNEKNPIENLTLSELKDIYQGKVKNWQELKSFNNPISLYGRNPASGTYEFFKEVVLKGDYSPDMKQMAGTAAIVDAVAQDVGGIGYVGLGYVKDVKGIKVLKIRNEKDGKYYTPLDVANLPKYPLARPLYHIVNKKFLYADIGKVLRDFIRWELTRGDKIIEEVGFVPLPQSEKEKALKLLEK
ncbi:MAG: PstS family phosphate ABC transporter substrate-binding protein [candidate division WOR-3 bacterium]|nr:PstS family phosphate ABC transporter substrate-binding protein [candidate division WOR-3 bacterium]MCX7836794.1 PstS family phosphate ABC transporter substrate-binding protein [candidate division WOR-3 bacterium]MDW8113568.1 PstS family phosphate ABC transporter substrate-binding protein [candidate division WOR-3 bacterium]